MSPGEKWKSPSLRSNALALPSYSILINIVFFPPFVYLCFYLLFIHQASGLYVSFRCCVLSVFFLQSYICIFTYLYLILFFPLNVLLKCTFLFSFTTCPPSFSIFDDEIQITLKNCKEFIYTCLFYNLGGGIQEGWTVGEANAELLGFLPLLVPE